MAKLVSVHAVSHVPSMVNFPGAIGEEDRLEIYAAFKQVGSEILAARPDVVIVVSDDHLHNFFLDNLPAFCIGAADRYPTPVEHWLKVEKSVLTGDASLGAHLLGEALQHDFDPALSMNLTLDHGTIVPLVLAGMEAVPVVPLLVNCVQPPLPTMRRCLQLGKAIGAAVRSYQGAQRVALLATGGISHDVATPRMGMVNESFDRTFLQHLAGGNEAALTDYAANHVNEAGNGAEEIRNWLVAHGAAGGAPAETILYKPMPAWFTGIGLVRWRVDGEEAA
ncbi:2,3-dihydroxyphenylpropionate 1,2-dioxygenase [Duganella sp. FT92W]|uniref:2,3-dihydroxyphenylpropionate 1,2-dioxygenase n=1 Tax=Pseudoduganella rivuli TaxID=2666085 RepID=A0A7X2III7_9BURK|nr:2,3-dihydroxyphenylpropionate 1,2-dioxygenase [Pseudoduganella rivuli]MRV70451.1 2,3-dihydroxyphenylpropionate 1,2-dioxygenase [Pseudoduganella rivuli]